MINEQQRETFLVQIGNQKNEHFRAVSTPIYLSTAFRHNEIGLVHEYDYIRTGNPTRDVLEKAVADLEKGTQAFACSSGMSAIHLVLSLFGKDDHIIASRDIYGGSFRLFEVWEEKYGFTFSYWEGTDFDALKALIQPNTKAVFLETPTNPLMKKTEISLTSDITEEYELLLIIDNTLYTPYIQRPLELGADVVIHSGTKYLAGHNDVLAGIVVSKDSHISDQLSYLHNSIGAVLAPFDCWTLIRGLKTLALRMNQHELNAGKVIDYLATQELVTQVLYPGRGGMVSFEITDESQVEKFLQSLDLITFAESFGGLESFITYPITQTHMDIPQEVRESYGLSNRLLRFSVGIEHADDLIEDLNQAFDLLKERG